MIPPIRHAPGHGQAGCLPGRIGRAKLHHAIPCRGNRRSGRASVILLGLTGGIGMGKSTAAATFRRLGLPVFDADRAVHRLQGRGGRAVRPIAAAFPDAVRDGAVDRDRLRQAVVFDTAALRRLEGIVHPLVRAEERAFVARARRAGRPAAVLDIPLLFETGGDRRVDRVVVVSAPAPVQRVRVRARRRMTDAQIAAIIARQVPDSEKRRRADAVVRTGLSRHDAQRQIRHLVAALRWGAPARLGRRRPGRPGRLAFMARGGAGRGQAGGKRGQR